MSDPKTPVALVTGGSRGIGLAIATCLGRAGYRLAINGRRDASEVSDALALLSTGQEPALYCQADISVRQQRQYLVQQLLDQFGRIDVLVNNAGIAPTTRADVLEATEQSFDQLIDVNLKGPYFLTQAVARWMVKQKQADKRFRGCIVNVTSVSATVASVNRGDYCISKAGLAMTTQLWSARLAEHGIDVYEVRPGIIATDMTAGVAQKYDHLIADGLTLERRWGTPEDVGRAVSLLARGELTYATGQILVVDGGMTQSRL